MRGLREYRRGSYGQPLRQDHQSGLPDDAAQMPFVIGAGRGSPAPPPAVLDLAAASRSPHPLDDRPAGRLSIRDLLEALLDRAGQRGQAFSNFRADVGVTDSLVLPSNIARNYLLIVNTGIGVVYCAFERAADAASGVPIVNGGSYEPILGTVSSVHLIAAAAQTVVVVEGFYKWK